jgi:hypothetical protein
MDDTLQGIWTELAEPPTWEEVEIRPTKLEPKMTVQVKRRNVTTDVMTFEQEGQNMTTIDITKPPGKLIMSASIGQIPMGQLAHYEEVDYRP